MDRSLQRSPFAKLPRELRDMIYKDALDIDIRVDLDIDMRVDLKRKNRSKVAFERIWRFLTGLFHNEAISASHGGPAYPALLGVCRQLYQECKPMTTFGKTTIHFDFASSLAESSTPRHISPLLEKAKDSVKDLGVERIRRSGATINIDLGVWTVQTGRKYGGKRESQFEDLGFVIGKLSKLFDLPCTLSLRPCYTAEDGQKNAMGSICLENNDAASRTIVDAVFERERKRLGNLRKAGTISMKEWFELFAKQYECRKSLLQFLELILD